MSTILPAGHPAGRTYEKGNGVTEVTPNPLENTRFSDFVILLFYDHPAKIPEPFFNADSSAV